MKNAVFIFTFLFSALASAEITDDNLNAAYKQTLSKNADNPELIEAVKQSQRDWLKFRKSQCTVRSGLYLRFNTDSMQTAFDDCIKEFNKERTTFLNKEELNDREF